MTAASTNDADTVADIVRAVPGVVGLHPGMFGEVATYLVGRRVPGIRVGADRIEVHLSVTAEAPPRETAAAVRDAVAAAFGGRTVDVTVEDIAVGPRRTTPTPHPTTGDRS
jgi:hypothetical protein